jgi:transcriptional regulator with XRE-family HTH domain
VAAVRGGKGKGPGAWQSSAAYGIALSKIVEARNEAGMTQRDLAEALGKPPSWVGKIESKERRIDLIEFIAVARAVGLKEADLFRVISANLPKRIEI